MSRNVASGSDDAAQPEGDAPSDPAAPTTAGVVDGQAAARVAEFMDRELQALAALCSCPDWCDGTELSLASARRDCAEPLLVSRYDPALQCVFDRWSSRSECLSTAGCDTDAILDCPEDYEVEAQLGSCGSFSAELAEGLSACDLEYLIPAVDGPTGSGEAGSGSGGIAGSSGAGGAGSAGTSGAGGGGSEGGDPAVDPLSAECDPAPGEELCGNWVVQNNGCDNGGMYRLCWLNRPTCVCAWFETDSGDRFLCDTCRDHGSAQAQVDIYCGNN